MSNNRIPIPGPLYSADTGNKVTTTNYIFDEEINKNQEQINSEILEALDRLNDGENSDVYSKNEVDALINSIGDELTNINQDLSDEITARENAINNLPNYSNNIQTIREDLNDEITRATESEESLSSDIIAINNKFSKGTVVKFNGLVSSATINLISPISNPKYVYFITSLNTFGASNTQILSGGFSSGNVSLYIDWPDRDLYTLQANGQPYDSKVYICNGVLYVWTGSELKAVGSEVTPEVIPTEGTSIPTIAKSDLDTLRSTDDGTYYTVIDTIGDITYKVGNLLVYSTTSNVIHLVFITSLENPTSSTFITNRTFIFVRQTAGNASSTWRSWKQFDIDSENVLVDIEGLSQILNLAQINNTLKEHFYFPTDSLIIEKEDIALGSIDENKLESTLQNKINKHTSDLVKLTQEINNLKSQIETINENLINSSNFLKTTKDGFFIVDPNDYIGACVIPVNADNDFTAYGWNGTGFNSPGSEPVLTSNRGGTKLIVWDADYSDMYLGLLNDDLGIRININSEDGKQIFTGTEFSLEATISPISYINEEVIWTIDSTSAKYITPKTSEGRSIVYSIKPGANNTKVKVTCMLKNYPSIPFSKEFTVTYEAELTSVTINIKGHVPPYGKALDNPATGTEFTLEAKANSGAKIYGVSWDISQNYVSYVPLPGENHKHENPCTFSINSNVTTPTYISISVTCIKKDGSLLDPFSDYFYVQYNKADSNLLNINITKKGTSPDDTQIDEQYTELELITLPEGQTITNLEFVVTGNAGYIKDGNILVVPPVTETFLVEVQGSADTSNGQRKTVKRTFTASAATLQELEIEAPAKHIYGKEVLLSVKATPDLEEFKDVVWSISNLGSTYGKVAIDAYSGLLTIGKSCKSSFVQVLALSNINDKIIAYKDLQITYTEQDLSNLTYDSIYLCGRCYGNRIEFDVYGRRVSDGEYVKLENSQLYFTLQERYTDLSEHGRFGLSIGHAPLNILTMSDLNNPADANVRPNNSYATNYDESEFTDACFGRTLATKNILYLPTQIKKDGQYVNYDYNVEGLWACCVHCELVTVDANASSNDEFINLTNYILHDKFYSFKNYGEDYGCVSQLMWNTQASSTINAPYEDKIYYLGNNIILGYDDQTYSDYVKPSVNESQYGIIFEPINNEYCTLTNLGCLRIKRGVTNLQITVKYGYSRVGEGTDYLYLRDDDVKREKILTISRSTVPTLITSISLICANEYSSTNVGTVIDGGQITVVDQNGSIVNDAYITIDSGINQCSISGGNPALITLYNTYGSWKEVKVTGHYKNLKTPLKTFKVRCPYLK